jgi:hypothetical protein
MSGSYQSLFLCQARIHVPHCHIHTKLPAVRDQIESGGVILSALSEWRPDCDWIDLLLIQIKLDPLDADRCER